MPEPIPVITLRRLAIDTHWQNQNLGEDLLQDAIKRIINASTDVGIKAILVHGISSKSKEFYLNRGFIESKINNMTLLLPLSSSAYHLE